MKYSFLLFVDKKEMREIWKIFNNFKLSRFYTPTGTKITYVLGSQHDFKSKSI